MMNQNLTKALSKTWDFSRLPPRELQAHMRRSIPGYDDGHNIIRLLSHYFINDHSRIYDIGCGPGRLTELLANEHHDKTGLEIIGIDPYVQHFPASFKEIEDSSFHNISFTAESCTSYPLKECDFAILYYTLQFLRPDAKQELLIKIFASLRRGGALLIFDKVIDDDPFLHDLQSGSYERFKLDQGLTPDEIINKKLSLMGCMRPLRHSSIIAIASNINTPALSSVVYKYLCFEGCLFIKE